MFPVSVTTKKSHKELLERFLGNDIRIGAREFTAINNCITMEWVDVVVPEDGIGEDRGVLYLFPADDLKFCLQLNVLHYHESERAVAEACAIRFLPAFFDLYPAEVLMANQPFRFDATTEQPFQVCSKTRLLTAKLQKEEIATPFSRSLKHTELAIAILARALECIMLPHTECQVPACRFLANGSDHDKIMMARTILDTNEDKPMTIRELLKKVAINECYLKKGFKTLVGKTINDYQQEQRIARAKLLLQTEGQSVTDVANTLGYSSISHFSTAFKRITGMKPCELLA